MSDKKQDSKTKRFMQLAKLTVAEEQFVRRKYTSSALIVIIAAIGLMLMTSVMVMFQDVLGNSFTLSLMIINALLFVAIVVIIFERLDDKILSNEFQNALFAGAAGSGLAFFFIVREDRRVVYYSPSCKDYFNFQPLFSGSDEFAELMLQMSVERIEWEHLFDAYQNKSEVALSLYMEDRQGVLHPLTLFVEAIPRPSGYYVFKALDKQYHQEKQANANKLADKERFTALWQDYLSTVPFGVLIIDMQGFILNHNKYALEMVDVHSIKGWQIAQIANDASVTDIEERMTAIKSGQLNSTTPLYIRLNHNEGKTAHLYFHNIEGQEEIVIYVMDGEGQRSMEEQFIQAQKMQAIGQLAGGIAHDFNNLLTAMSGHADLLLTRHGEEDESHDDLMQIKKNARRASNLVRQLLAFSRKQTLQAEPVSLENCLDDLSEMLYRLIGEHIQFRMDIAPNLPPVMVDEGQFEQVIVNLAVNARDAMSKGGNLSISAYERTVSHMNLLDPEYNIGSAEEIANIIPGTYIAIEITDSGHGIPAHIISQIFEPFFSTKDKAHGTGLGLATVYGIIKQMNGHILVKTEQDKGTTFLVLLEPMDTAQIDMFVQQSAKEEIAEIKTEKEQLETPIPEIIEEETVTKKDTCILIVEDEMTVRSFAARALEMQGYRVLQADDGETALDIMENQSHEVDLVLTDVMMPGMTGPSMVEKLITDHDYQGHIMFMSGYGEDAFKDVRGHDRDFHFIPKPFELDQLVEKVKEIL